MNQVYQFRKGLVVGLLAGIGGSYLMYKNREKLSHAMWKLRAKADLHRRLKNLKSVTKETYDQLVDDVMAKYSDVGTITEYEIDSMSEELKKRWKSVKHQFEETLKPLKEEDEE